MKYEVINDFKSNKHYYLEFLNIVKKSSVENNLSFEDWMLMIKWDENYVPFGLIDESGTLLAFCGVRKTTITSDGVKYSGAQLGKIYTKREQDKEEIESTLISKIVKKYENIVDLIYLFNDDLNSPLLLKQGFEVMPNYSCTLQWDATKSISNSGVRRIDVDNPTEMNNLYLEIKHSSKMSKAMDINGDALIKTYNIMKYYPRNVFHVPSLDTTIVSTIEDNIFHLWGVFSKNDFDMEKLLNLVVPQSVEKVAFGFVPQLDNIKINERHQDKNNHELLNSTLYVKQISVSLPKKQIKFPVLTAEK